MATLIQFKGGPAYYVSESIEDVKGMLDRGEVVTVWWFSPWGQRYKERLWASLDEVAYLRTESDD